ncbi:hypothetical protein RhiirA5_409518 [Rhizophagus irregularis]|uniref:Uncharacterized protein n=2 Tax=Rhizophagus irregularis TaxID=588596 RepID=A0A2I1ENB8_9GLOM|nr:hypothetical protein RirG_086590 [Rhizophagus irregularis DAOM 197198w]PKC02780.1 hypothetical protein RhiirA5_424741 [Rhizophagus irregularis]PKC14324.1 hypothetical protein RhiirA5_409518 [Rhizophagus irregularis]PKC73338.1 hypothetical protein RhiirA1_451314 [Rhizophagus irregularis]PKK70453.1 hypothetical protein RhiirC2_779697 [Rhizophagus irregularis]
MSLRIQLILILTFFTTHGLTYTLEKREIIHQEELPGQSLQSLFGPILVICLLTFDMFVLFSCALASKLTKNWIDVDYVFYNLNENIQDTTQNIQSARSSTSTNYVLDHEDEQSTVAIQLPITNTTKSINRINQPPDEFNSIITIHNQNELPHTRSIRKIQVPTISHTNSTRLIQNQTSNNNSTGKMLTQKLTLINKPIRESSLRANTVRMNPKMKPSQLPALYSYI